MRFLVFYALEVWFVVVLAINEKHTLPVKHANRGMLGVL
jgi:hypothetical protein